MFVLKSPDSVFVWKGAGASDEEMVAAKYVVSVLDKKSTDVAEGKEPGESPPCFFVWGAVCDPDLTPFICNSLFSWILVSFGWEEGIPNLSNSKKYGQTTTSVRLLQ